MVLKAYALVFLVSWWSGAIYWFAKRFGEIALAGPGAWYPPGWAATLALTAQALVLGMGVGVAAVAVLLATAAASRRSRRV